MHRTDRKRRLLLLNRTQPATSGIGADTGVAMDSADEGPGDAAFDEFAVSSHILAPDPGEKFLAACRTAAAVPRLRIYPDADSAPFEFGFRRPYALIGRSERCDLRFDHQDVSYRHAYLQVVGGRLHCFDLASRTGTRGANGDRAGGPLVTRGRILVGPVTIENLDPAEGGSSDTSLLLANDPQAELPPVFLEWPAGHGKPPRTARLERAINLLGWSKACHVRFERDAVSRVHASLVVTPAGVWLVDLLGRDGTLLDGKRVVFARLNDGAELQIGACGFRLRLGDPPREAPPRRRARRDRRPDVVINQNFVLPGFPGSVAPAGPMSTDSQPGYPLPAGFPASAGDHGSENRATLGAAPGSLPTAAAGGVSEGFVLSLFGQFAEMQRAMFSQTQQQMMFLTQMLGSLHQNQQDLIREDMRRVHDIDRELQLLQMQLFQQSLARPASPQYRLTAAGENAAQGEGHASSPAPRAGEAGGSGGSESGEEIVDVTFDLDQPAQPAESSPQNELNAAGAEALPADDDGSDVVPLFDEDEEQLPQQTPPSGEGPAAEPRSPRRGAEQHAWLTERMHRLERERNSRWQKIMSLLTGGRS